MYQVGFEFQPWKLHQIALPPARLTRPTRSTLTTWDILIRRYTRVLGVTAATLPTTAVSSNKQERSRNTDASPEPCHSSTGLHEPGR